MRALVALTFAAIAATTPRVVRADDAAPERATPSPAPPEPPEPPQDESAHSNSFEIDPEILHAERFRRVAVLANPFSYVIGRVGFDVDIMVAEHHAIMIEPFFTVQNKTFVLFTDDERHQLGYGFELGYRYFGGTRGPNGLFIGPTAFVGHNHVDSGVDNNLNPTGALDYTFVGGALDMGAQGILDSSFTIGAGLGAGVTQRLGSSLSFSPRLLFTIGYAF